MRQFLIAGVMSIALLAGSTPRASAWIKIEFGINAWIKIKCSKNCCDPCCCPYGGPVMPAYPVFDGYYADTAAQPQVGPMPNPVQPAYYYHNNLQPVGYQTYATYGGYGAPSYWYGE